MIDRPVIAVSLGDPGGIGPEITVRALADEAIARTCIPVVYGAPDVWSRACSIAGLDVPLAEVRSATDARGPSLVACDDAALDALPFGEATAAGGRAQAAYLARAVDELVAGRAHGLCTAPVNKAAVHRAGLEFVGHTEYLQERFGVPRVVMLMAGERLRVALVTTHVAIAEVPRRVTREEIVAVTELTARELHARFGLESPRIAVCGLNPHAGEDGKFGDEELRVVAPAIAELRARGLRVDGPFAADGLFPRAVEAGFDAVVAMYHDQGLIPFKVLEFHDGVNVTLGLPRPRTSPDHGVAYDIAGRGVADPRSMKAALRLCIRLAASRR